MRTATRYYSLHGNTRAIARETGVQAISITDEPALTEHVDVLFRGGTPYWSVMGPALEEYAKNSTPLYHSTW